MFTKEEILEKIKQAVRTLFYRKSEFSDMRNSILVLDTMHGLLGDDFTSYIEQLTPSDYNWLTTQYEIWFKEEMANHPEVIKTRKNLI